MGLWVAAGGRGGPESYDISSKTYSVGWRLGLSEGSKILFDTFLISLSTNPARYIVRQMKNAATTTYP
jgi:hypothetical protein